ncbi:CCAAT/enhancer-binding protein zeta-like, partial [Octopus sinensis]|uniref:CCAAT/enhancer-binding protein zeta-like n=1 Tax=Octopus sinensis TaxID=2607531 RepID=A0A6P7U3L5_9MOLL
KPIELLVNKLGDQNKDLASTALFYIQSLVRRMPHCNQAFIKRLLQVCLQHHNPAFVAASLIMISEITSKIHVILFETTGTSENEDRFNPTERNPRFCGLDASLGFLCVCRNELELLSSHVHPTISYFRKSISYQGHPLQDFSSIRFLDRFVFKKPQEEGRVIMSQKKIRHCVGIRALPVNSVQFINSHQSSIPLDERYLHQ